MMEQPMTPASESADLPQLMPAEPRQAGPIPTFADLDEAAGGPAEAPTGFEAVYDVPVRVQAVLGRSRMPIGELLRLRTGHVVELDRRVGEPVDIYVNDRLIARGEVVMIDDSLGVTLTEIIRKDR
jgi:flagellar motor switch protein FliN/FliY